MQLTKTTTGLLALTLTALLTGCESQQTEKDMLAEAQYCLDKATATTASACMSKISGLSSPQAYALRCAEGFISADVTSPQNLADAMNAISEGSGATGLLSAISFPDTTAANKTFNDCNLSNSSGLAMIGAMAKSATILASVAASFPSCSTPEACNTAIAEGIDNLIGGLSSGDLADKAEAERNVTEIVSAVTTVYATSCSSASSENSEMCAPINAAAAAAGVDINAMTEQEKLDLGKQLLAEWKK